MWRTPSHCWCLCEAVILRMLASICIIYAEFLITLTCLFCCHVTVNAAYEAVIFRMLVSICIIYAEFLITLKFLFCYHARVNAAYEAVILKC
jgi:hypothetical protein